MKLLPGTLFGRVALIFGLALALAHGLTLLIIVRERGDLGLTMMTSYLGRDVAASVAILDRVPAAERPAWLPALDRQNYRYRLQAPPERAHPSQHRLAAPLTASVSERLGAQLLGPMTEAPQAPGQHRSTMYLPLRLSDGAPLTLELTPPQPSVSAVSVTLLLLQLVSLAGAGWLAVRLAVRPVTQLARAADAITDGARAPLPAIDGPTEVRQAMHAFNTMQARIEGQLAERLHLLAAISHDLQTPITRMRLRAEQIEPAGLRDKVLHDLLAMQRLVDEGLTYARTAHAAAEPERLVDLKALLDGLVCDACDAGGQVTLVEPVPSTVQTRVQALRRVLTNLIDNAVTFGTRAEVHACETAHAWVIWVCDDGPGIPTEHLERVFDPFFRLEGSRSRETGGTGLGLAIARQLSLALGAQLTLHNRSTGGLEARLTLSRTPALSQKTHFVSP
jgi:signal transduction histidine kinase